MDTTSLPGSFFALLRFCFGVLFFRSPLFDQPETGFSPIFRSLPKKDHIVFRSNFSLPGEFLLTAQHICTCLRCSRLWSSRLSFRGFSPSVRLELTRTLKEPVARRGTGLADYPLRGISPPYVKPCRTFLPGGRSPAVSLGISAG